MFVIRTRTVVFEHKQGHCYTNGHPFNNRKSGMQGSHSYGLRNILMSRFMSEPLSITIGITVPLGTVNLGAIVYEH